MRSAKDFFAPLAVGAPDPVREIPARPSRAIHFFDPSNEKMASKIPDMVGKVDVLLGNLEDAIKADNKIAAREGLVKIARDTRLRAHPAVDPDQRARLALGPRRPNDACYRDRRQARRGDGAEGAGRRGHPLRRPAARPARGQGRAGAADPGARDPRDRARHGEHRGDLRRLAADAGALPRPGRPGRRPPDEDDPRRWRSPRLPGAPGPGLLRQADIEATAADVPAGPVALHDRPDGRRVRDARDLPVLRAVRRHRRRGRVRGPVPQRVPARLRRHLVAAPQADRHRQQGVQPLAGGRRARAARGRGDGRRHRRGDARRQDGGRRLPQAVPGDGRARRAAGRDRPGAEEAVRRRLSDAS